MIETGLFDLDETLTDRTASLSRYAALFHREFAELLGAVSVGDIDSTFVALDGRGYRPREEVYAGIADQLPWAFAPDTSTIRHHWRTWFPASAVARVGLHETLAALAAAGVRLGVVTNGSVLTQSAKIAHLASGGAPPPLSLPGMGDHCSALTLFGAIMLGLYEREKTGRGTHVRSSLMGNGVWANAIQVQAMLCGASVDPRPPREKVSNALANRYQAGDGRWFLLTILQQGRDWDRFLAAIGREDVGEDTRFKTAGARTVNAEALVRVLDEVFSSRPWDEWRPRLEAYDLAFESVRSLDQLAEDPQIAATDTFVPLEGTASRLRTVASPIELVGVMKRPPGAAPALGEHNHQILNDLGYQEGEVEILRLSGALGAL